MAFGAHFGEQVGMGLPFVPFAAHGVVGIENCQPVPVFGLPFRSGMGDGFGEY